MGWIIGLLIVATTGFFTPLNYQIPVTITAYSPHENQTDSTPFLTASQRHVREGYIALSRDLESEFGLKFGDSVHVNGVEYEFQDRMHKRWTKRVDIFMWTKKEALEFGKQQGFMEVKNGRTKTLNRNIQRSSR